MEVVNIFLPMTLTYQVLEHAVGHTLGLAQRTFIVGLHFTVGASNELPDESQTHNLVIGLNDLLLESYWLLLPGRSRITDRPDRVLWHGLG